MESPLSPKTLDEIQGLARQISVANRLDQDIQAELAGHVEDKVRGYLTGEEKVSEADALLLARTHFGKPGVIKSLFQSVHAPAAALTLFQRLAAAMALTALVVFTMLSLHWLALILDVTGWLPLHLRRYDRAFAWYVLSILTFNLMVWGGLAYWRRRLDVQRPLCKQWALWQPLLLVLLAIVAIIATTYVANRPPYFVDNEDWHPTVWRICLGRTLSMMSNGWTLLLWLWWCDRAPRGGRTLLITAAAWLMLTLVLQGVEMAPMVIMLKGAPYLQTWISGRMHNILVTFGFEAAAALLFGVAYSALMRRRRAAAEN